MSGGAEPLLNLRLQTYDDPRALESTTKIVRCEFEVGESGLSTLFAKKQTTINSAIVLMLEAALREAGFPFSTSKPKWSTVKAIRKAISRKGRFGTYDNFDDAIAAILQK